MPGTPGCEGSGTGDGRVPAARAGNARADGGGSGGGGVGIVAGAGSLAPSSLSPSGSSGVAHQPSTGTARRIPPAPKTRSRGFSLRRAAFARNLALSDQNAVELDPEQGALPALAEPAEVKGHVEEEVAGRLDALSSSPGKQETVLSHGKHSKPSSVTPPGDGGIWAQRKRHAAKFKSSVIEIFKIITRNRDIPPSKNGRHIDLDPTFKGQRIDERTGKGYIGNTITSSRYNFFNFLPRQIIFQFSRVSNFYFLCVSILQLTGFSTTGTYSTIVPLMVFVSIAIAKEGYDDYRRHVMDRVENRSKVEVLRIKDAGDASWLTVKWYEVKVGDIVKLGRNDAIPADLVLIYADGPNGLAYIDTAALDGESNLKAKQAPTMLRESCQSESDVPRCRAHIVVEDPNIDLYNFDGQITIDGKTLPLTGSEIIYRGSVLRNTSNAFGMVINTGEECKIRMNAMRNPRAKAPSMQHIVNQIVVIIACFVMLLTGLNLAAYRIWRSKEEDDATYLMGASIKEIDLFLSAFVMFSNMIPLSLYISLEIVKVGQMYMMGDIEMYDAESNTPMEPHTNTINEELGQVSHVFSDKTGTLTENIMRFRKMSVAGTAWLHDFDLRKPEAVERVPSKQPHPTAAESSKFPGYAKQISDPGSMELMDSEPTARHGSRMSRQATRESTSLYRQSSMPSEKREPTTEELVTYLQRGIHGAFAEKARFFLLAIALCHTALPETRADGEIDYQAMSPDELALVRGAKDLGYIVVDRPSQSVTILSKDGDKSTRETYQVLDVVEFSSKRKRMSIIIRFPDGKICLFCKGADSTILERLDPVTGAVQKDADIRRSMTAMRRSEAQEELRRGSQDSPRSSLSRPIVSRAGSYISRPSLARNRSTADGTPGMDALGRILNDSPRPSMAVSRKSSTLANSLMIDHVVAGDDSAILNATLRHIHDFATEGLRTLLYGHRYLGEEEYQTWKKAFHEASTSLVNRQELIDQASESLEKDLVLTGATAIEDELQKGVPETIEKLRRAGMPVWMLTGDKRETAINIGYSCKLITSYSDVVILDHEQKNVDSTVANALLDISQGQVAHCVVVVDGQTLADIEGNPTLMEEFFKLVIAANSIICCRASPTQKAFLVKTIRTKVKGSITLAVGDSANDIAMIQEAHVGIGISGKEGMQAARTSDYSIGQFRFLQRLLLVHGRWNYVRTAKYVLGTFWKEMMFFLTQTIYQPYNGFTGTSFYEYWTGSVVNVFFVALCIIILGVFDQDLSATTLLAIPELYRRGQRNVAFNLSKYAWWNLMALADAVIIFYTVYGLYGTAIFNDVFEDSSDLFAYGQLSFAVCIIVINTKLMFLVMHNRDITSFTAWFLGVLAWWLWNLALSGIYDPAASFYGVKHGFVDRFGRSALWWLTLLVATAAPLLWEIAVESVRVAYWPDEVDVFQELENDPMWRARFEAMVRGEEAREERESGDLKGS
ncbi:aminophospholipid-translocating ATPase [Drepanopeziza brunnea f. sp. 'multigermtubi' MB_m1]|uniref:Phospholipid-transporting ATPase n=1 Tax=Marssonina brunnea f. sp. multigermtubi (strain MB_m1) TaxID=1072389 RepID=K1WTX3_MARBU|nr:aminophospholipid-translocating ATPase [Drepanopeziza brunnea f. sp. 'multigermtubi' MB_m1]EKD16506.1 aminophospholipid-translocating ATPase [Drepanopeziza brunnea f. sp. 'multigermtubi' MB_m1]